MNNADILGEEAAVRQIVEDDFSATNGHFEDDSVTVVRERGFSKKSFISVKLPNALTVNNYAFEGAGANNPYHRKILLPKATSIMMGGISQGSYLCYLIDAGMISSTNGFSNHHLYHLCAVVFRNPNLVTMSSTGDFTGSYSNFSTADGCGYIYVPRDLIPTYQTATNWSVIFSNKPNVFRALEDYTVDGTTTGELDESKMFVPATPLYSLENREFNGTSDYIDTGIKLFDGNHDDFTIVIDYTVTALRGNERIIHCFDESVKDGFWFGRHTNNNNQQGCKYSPPTTGNDGLLPFDDDGFTAGARVKTAIIIKDNTLYTLHSRIDKFNFNGNAKYNQTYTRTRGSVATLQTTMLIGAGRNSGGNIYGYFTGKINNLKIYDGRIEDWQITEELDIRPEDTP